MDWRKYWWLPGFTLAFLTVGVPYWAIPYHKVNMPGAVLGVSLLMVVAVAALTRTYSGMSFIRTTAVMGAVLPAAVMVRVIVEVARDPTSHNLWPFEVVIALFVGSAAAAVGALLGTAGLWLLRRGRGQTDEDAP